MFRVIDGFLGVSGVGFPRSLRRGAEIPQKYSPGLR